MHEYGITAKLTDKDLTKPEGMVQKLIESDSKTYFVQLHSCIQDQNHRSHHHHPHAYRHRP